MSNMSYCRFENTSKDLSDCLEALRDRIISSDREKKIAKKMIKEIINFLSDESIINDWDDDYIGEIINECE